MNYLNFYSLLREKNSDKFRTLSSKKLYSYNNFIYNFLFIIDGKILMVKKNPFFFKSEKVSKEFNNFNLSFISNIGNNLFILCYTNSIKAKKISFLKDYDLFNIRDTLSNLKKNIASIVSAGYSLYKWQYNNKYCGKCGSLNKFEENGNSLLCTNNSCKKKIFPIVYPTVIVNIINKDKILLARNHSWKNNLYSCLAGFCEQNESAEDAVRREVYEEVGLELETINYKYSQYWPYSSNLMLGYEAKVVSKSSKIKIDKQEIEKARWFSSKEIKRLSKQKKILLPRKEAIAYSLISDWLKKN
tara:strand:+ start:1565 stop:2467 length:903 start_codon:yes stop_codon:yes gene_type:complete